MLEVRNLTKLFNRIDKKTKKSSKVGITNISFTANEGRIFGLLGANGAGKTTTMRMIADLTYPQSGEILLDGKLYKEIRNLKMQISFVSGETQVYDRLTGFEVIELFGKISGLNERSLKIKIDELIQKLEMSDFINDVCSNYSTGMKQKVSIARALITDPKVLVFDEVTNGLDIFASKSVRDQIRLLRDEGKIIVYSTHIMPDAEELCDDIAILHRGEVLISGSKDEIKQKTGEKTVQDIFFKIVEEKDPKFEIL